METIKSPDWKTLDVSTLKVPENDAVKVNAPLPKYSGEDRMPKVKQLTHELHGALKEYERRRIALHKLLGDIWLIEDRYQTLVGSHSPMFEERVYFEVNLPRLLPLPPRANAMWSTPFSTTQAAHQGYMGDYKRQWPAPPLSGFPEDSQEISNE